MAQDIYPTHKQPMSFTVWQPWDSATAYVVDNRVSVVTVVGDEEQVAYYRAILDNTDEEPPNATYWVLENPVPGPVYTTYTKHPKNWNEVTLESKFEDGGVDTNQSADDVPQRWTLEYKHKKEAPSEVIKEFWHAHRRTVAFTFVEPRNTPFTRQQGDVVENVFFEDFEDNGHGKREFQNSFTVKLIKYPS